jgi:hypothetical protein
MGIGSSALCHSMAHLRALTYILSFPVVQELEGRISSSCQPDLRANAKPDRFPALAAVSAGGRYLNEWPFIVHSFSPIVRSQ